STHPSWPPAGHPTPRSCRSSSARPARASGPGPSGPDRWGPGPSGPDPAPGYRPRAQRAPARGTVSDRTSGLLVVGGGVSSAVSSVVDCDTRAHVRAVVAADPVRSVVRGGGVVGLLLELTLGAVGDHGDGVVLLEVDE